MGRQSGDATKASSSIALLQERFRQLQKVKERREEKELLRMISESEKTSLSFQSEVIHPHSHGQNTPQESLSLGLDLQAKQADHHLSRRTQPLTNLWPDGSASASSSKSFDNSDIDTSLHL